MIPKVLQTDRVIGDVVIVSMPWNASSGIVIVSGMIRGVFRVPLEKMMEWIGSEGLMPVQVMSCTFRGISICFVYSRT